MKYFEFKGNKCCFYISTYTNNDRIYIEMDTEDGDIWCDVTINLTRMKIPGEDYAFIDTANTPALKEFLLQNDFATETEIEVSNHYNVYPLYKLNLDKIREYGLEDTGESSLFEWEGYMVSEHWDV